MKFLPPRFQKSISIGLLFLAIALSGCSQRTVKVGVDEGIAAYKRGDYATALKVLRPLAEQGDASAQSDLGVMYEKGQGVPQDYKEAVRWYQIAANQGNATAQFNLARMYGLGQGVRQDPVYAHMWLSLAVANGNQFRIAEKTRDALEKLMTPAQIAEAQRLAREWKPKKSR